MLLVGYHAPRSPHHFQATGGVEGEQSDPRQRSSGSDRSRDGGWNVVEFQVKENSGVESRKTSDRLGARRRKKPAPHLKHPNVAAELTGQRASHLDAGGIEGED